MLYQKPTTNIPLIIEQLIKFVCVSDIPLGALDNIYFRQFLNLLNPNFDFPQRETMAKRINLFANRYENLANKKIFTNYY